MPRNTIVTCLLLAVWGGFVTPLPAGDDGSPSASFRAEVGKLRAEGKLRACVEMLDSALQQWPDDADVWLLLLDIELQRKRYAATLRTCEKAHQALGGHPGIHLRRGQAYLALGAVLGEIQQRKIPSGRVGQFSNRWLVVEKGKRNGTFVCCQEQSALYQVRRALDAGCVEPQAHLLHARIWQSLERPALAWAILQAHESAIVELGDAETLETCSALALANDEVGAYLTYERLRAKQVDEAERAPLLQHAYEQVASVYGRSGRVALQAAFLQRAAVLHAPSADLSLQLGDALWSLNKHAEASLWYRRVLEKEPRTSQRDRILSRLAIAAESGDGGSREQGTGNRVGSERAREQGS